MSTIERKNEIFVDAQTFVDYVLYKNIGFSMNENSKCK
jgi:hypothetical protein